MNRSLEAAARYRELAAREDVKPRSKALLLWAARWLEERASQ